MKLVISAALLLVVCEAQISQNCVGGICGQNNVAASAGTRISQNCATSACIQNNIGRKKREIANAVLALTEETLEAEKKEIQKREAEAQIIQSCSGSSCAQNNVAAGYTGTPISQNCEGSTCIQNNVARKKREIVDAINSLTEEVLEAEEAEKREIQKREAEAQISQNCVGGICGQNNVAANAGTRISQNCLTSACIQNNFGRRKREVIAKLLEEAHKLAEEEAEAEALDTQSRKKRSFTHLLP
jgi:hypothetical protein